MNDAQAERLTVAEMKIQQHEKLHEETARMIKSISEGVEAVVRAEVRREGDAQTFERIFNALKTLEESFEQYKDQQMEKELAAYRGLVWKGIGLFGLVMASYVAGHLGVRLLG